MAEINGINDFHLSYKLSDVPSAEKLEKFVEDVKWVSRFFLIKTYFWKILLQRYGIYPLTAFEAKKPPYPKSRPSSPVAAESVKSVTPEPVDVELRRIVNMMCSVKNHEDSCDLAVGFLVLVINVPLQLTVIQKDFLFQMTILLRMDDKMNRQLTCIVSQDDSANSLSNELVHLGFIHDVSFLFYFLNFWIK